jgi:hypothetical protein
MNVFEKLLLHSICKFRCQGGGSGCVLWFGSLIDISEYSDSEGGQDLYIRMATSELGTVSLFLFGFF